MQADPSARFLVFAYREQDRWFARGRASHRPLCNVIAGLVRHNCVTYLDGSVFCRQGVHESIHGDVAVSSRR